jgi:hypothetical protein
VTIPAVIAEVFDEAHEIEICARHGCFLFFSNDFVLRLWKLLELPLAVREEVTADLRLNIYAEIHILPGVCIYL